MHVCPLGESILATPEYEIHGFQIPYYIFQDANLRGDFFATFQTSLMLFFKT